MNVRRLLVKFVVASAITGASVVLAGTAAAAGTDGTVNPQDITTPGQVDTTTSNTQTSNGVQVTATDSSQVVTPPVAGSTPSDPGTTGATTTPGTTSDGNATVSVDASGNVTTTPTTTTPDAAATVDTDAATQADQPAATSVTFTPTVTYAAVHYNRVQNPQVVEVQPTVSPIGQTAMAVPVGTHAPTPVLPTGFLTHVTNLLNTIIVPVVAHGFVPSLATVLMGAAAWVLRRSAGILVVGGSVSYLSMLRRSGFARAARGSGVFNIVTSMTYELSPGFASG